MNYGKDINEMINEMTVIDKLIIVIIICMGLIWFFTDRLDTITFIIFVFIGIFWFTKAKDMLRKKRSKDEKEMQPRKM